MREPKDFVVELRADVAHMPHHPYTADLITRAADEIERLRAALQNLIVAADNSNCSSGPIDDAKAALGLDEQTPT